MFKESLCHEYTCTLYNSFNNKSHQQISMEESEILFNRFKRFFALLGPHWFFLIRFYWITLDSSFSSIHLVSNVWPSFLRTYICILRFECCLRSPILYFNIRFIQTRTNINIFVRWDVCWFDDFYFDGFFLVYFSSFEIGWLPEKLYKFKMCHIVWYVCCCQVEICRKWKWIVLNKSKMKEESTNKNNKQNKQNTIQCSLEK